MNAAQAAALATAHAQQMSDANRTLLSTKAELSSGWQTVQDTTRSLARSASAYEAQAKQAMGASASSDARIQQLDADLASLDSLMSSNRWADALQLAESANQRAKTLASGAGGGLPLPAIALSILLLLAIGYVLLFRGQKKDKSGKEGGGPKPAAPSVSTPTSSISSTPASKKLERAES
jgi:hypothetical protein